jgi:hypothetical protein
LPPLLLLPPDTGNALAQLLLLLNCINGKKYEIPPNQIPNAIPAVVDFSLSLSALL